LVICKGRTSIQGSWPWWRWILTGLNTLALVLSIILSWHYLVGGSMVGCGGGSPCEQVLNSRWSIIAGRIPVSGLAVGVYLAFLVAGFFIGPSTETPIRNLAWSAMLILVGSISGSAIWFTILQKWVIGDFCCAGHLAGDHRIRKPIKRYPGNESHKSPEYFPGKVTASYTPFACIGSGSDRFDPGWQPFSLASQFYSLSNLSRRGVTE
jgi:uncharacterized membrane protein